MVDLNLYILVSIIILNFERVLFVMKKFSNLGLNFIQKKPSLLLDLDWFIVWPESRTKVADRIPETESIYNRQASLR